MKITLSMVMTTEMDTMVPPLSLLVLNSILEQTHHQVRVVFPIELEDFMETAAFELRDCDVFGLSCNSFNWFNTRKIIEQIHQHIPNITIVLGGPHASSCHLYCLRSTPAHVVVRDEGEFTFPSLLDALERGLPLENVAGITFKTQAGNIVANPDRPLMTEAELNATPLPSYEIIPSEKYDYVTMETSRGCLFKCIFCAIPFPGLRFYNIERISQALNKISAMDKKFGKNAVFISDDSFSAKRAHAAGVLELFRDEHPDLTIGAEVRISEILKHDLISYLEPLKFFLLQVGIECGYDEGMRLIRKGLTTKKTLEFADICSQTSFHYEILLSFVIGFPWEKKTHITKTIDFAVNCARILRCRHPQINNFVPYPDTPMVINHEKYGLKAIPPDHYDDSNWFTEFLGYTDISQQDREFLFQYLQQELQQHSSFLEQGLPQRSQAAVPVPY